MSIVHVHVCLCQNLFCGSIRAMVTSGNGIIYRLWMFYAMHILDMIVIEAVSP